MRNLLTFAVGVFLILFTVGFGHEYIHAVVAVEYGCDADIDLMPDLKDGYVMKTSYECPASMSESREVAHQVAQLSVEIVGYHLFFIALPTLIAVTYLMRKNAILDRRLRLIQDEIQEDED